MASRTQSGHRIVHAKILLCESPGCQDALNGKYWKHVHTLNMHIAEVHGNINKQGPGQYNPDFLSNFVMAGIR